MNYTTLFYWLVVADNARDFFRVFMILFTVIVVIATVFYFLHSRTDYSDSQTKNDEENQSMSRKWIWWSTPFAVLFWALFVFTPSKKDALLIVAGGQTLNFLTNDKSAKQIPAELSGYLLTEIKNQAKEAAVDLNISSQKDKILEKAKNMSTKELLEEMKTDSTFAKIILEK